MDVDLSQVRFFAIVDDAYVRTEAMPRVCQALIDGGAGMIEFRAKNLAHAERENLVDTLAPICAQAGVPLIINDHLDLALRHPGLGLHVGQDDMPVAEARKALGTERILGLSTHSLDQAKGALALAEHLSYFAVGPVFPTQTKPDYASVGLELVSQVAALNPALPFFTIGGINRGNVCEVLRAGASRVCAVSDILQDADPAQATRELLAAMERCHATA